MRLARLHARRAGLEIGACGSSCFLLAARVAYACESFDCRAQALLAVCVFWWLIERSTLGFQLRAVGANPDAARTAGISVGRVTAVTMAISGAFMGLAGANEALGTIGYVSRDVAGSIGFDAITVALLGRNKPLGTLGAGLLFGAFKAGGYTMQAKGVPIDMILILQSVIVLLIAAPALVRWLFRLPKENKTGLRAQLAALGAELNRRVLRRWMVEGVGVTDPSSTWVDVTVELARDVELEPGALLRGRTRVGEGTRVGAYSILTDVDIPAGARVAPFSLLDGDAPARGV